MITCEIYSGSWLDVSDYLLTDGTSAIPFIERNSDWTLIASTFDITISSVCNYTIDQGLPFRFVESSSVLFAGYADSIEYDYANKYYRIQIANDLQKLNDIKLDSITLHPIISGSSGGNLYNYNPDDYVYVSEHFSSISLMYALKCCFQAAGLTLDTSEIDNVVSGKWIFAYEEIDVPFNRLALDYQAFYCMGQSVACNSDKINSDYYDSKISLMEFISWICRTFRLTFKITDVNSYKVFAENTSYTINDDDKYDYSNTIQLKEYEKSFVSIYAPQVPDSSLDHRIRHWFYQSEPHTLIKYIALDGWLEGDPPYPAGGDHEIEYLSNLIIMPYNYNVDTDEWSPNMVHPESYGLVPIMLWPTSASYSLRKYLIEQENKDIQKEKITTEIQTEIKSVTKNFINLSDLTSEIEQEIYL
jgi:hypothetical protein